VGVPSAAVGKAPPISKKVAPTRTLEMELVAEGHAVVGVDWVGA
jgi:hypothetical protein